MRKGCQPANVLRTHASLALMDRLAPPSRMVVALAFVTHLCYTRCDVRSGAFASVTACMALGIFRDDRDPQASDFAGASGLHFPH